MESEISSDVEIQKVLENRARALARTGDAALAEQDMLRLLAFSMGEERFGVNMNYIQEIQPLKREMWSLVPCTPNFIVGAANIRGRIYSIMNIAAYLEIGAELNMEKAHVLLIRGETKPSRMLMEFCILAEDRPKLEQVPLTAIQPASETLSAKGQEFIKGVTSNMLMILDLEKLISHPGIIVREESI
jgi:purine-binding chemotaxis protein CheW